MTSKSALELVVELRTLASAPGNRAQIIGGNEGDTVMPMLVMFLDHPASDVVFNALETVYYLSLYPPNRHVMIKNVYLMPKLKSLMVNGRTAEIKRKAIATFTSMKKAVAAPDTAAATEAVPAAAAAATATAAAAPLASVPSNVADKVPVKPMASFGFGGGEVKSAAVTLTLFMKELHSEANKAAFERALVNYKGIVSFWVELKTHKAVLRTTLTEEQVCKAVLAQLGWIASTDAAYVAPSNAGYLDEEAAGENGAIVQRASKKKAKEQAAASGGGGWFSSVTSYLW